MDEQTIKKMYIEKPDEEVRLICSYTTRKEGFLDIILSNNILCSQEARELLGKIKTHRGSSMSTKPIERYGDLNSYISFSTGTVAFRYNNSEIRTIEEYSGGYGIFIPLETLLEFPNISFSHSSHAGGIRDFKLTKENIINTTHIARKSRELYTENDGYGKLFEVSLDSEIEKNKETIHQKIISYPRLELKNSAIIAIPENERETILSDIIARQTEYKLFLDKIANRDSEELKFKIIEGRELFYVHNITNKMIPHIEQMIKPIDIDELPILWYKERNLEIALQYQSIINIKKL